MADFRLVCPRDADPAQFDATYPVTWANLPTAELFPLLAKIEPRLRRHYGRVQSHLTDDRMVLILGSGCVSVIITPTSIHGSQWNVRVHTDQRALLKKIEYPKTAVPA